MMTDRSSPVRILENRDQRLMMTEHDPSSKPAVSRSFAGLSGESLRTAGRFLIYLWPYRGKFAAAQVCLLLLKPRGFGVPLLYRKIHRQRTPRRRQRGRRRWRAGIRPRHERDRPALVPAAGGANVVLVSPVVLAFRSRRAQPGRPPAGYVCASDPDADGLFQRAQGRRADKPAGRRSHGDSAHADRHDSRSAPPGSNSGWRFVFDRVDFGQVDLGDAAFGARGGGVGRCSGPQDP